MLPPMKSRTASSNVYGSPASVSSSARIELASRSESTSTPSLSKITRPVTQGTLRDRSGGLRGQLSWTELALLNFKGVEGEPLLGVVGGDHLDAVVDLPGGGVGGDPLAGLE